MPSACPSTRFHRAVGPFIRNTCRSTLFLPSEQPTDSQGPQLEHKRNSFLRAGGMTSEMGRAVQSVQLPGGEMCPHRQEKAARLKAAPPTLGRRARRAGARKATAKMPGQRTRRYVMKEAARLKAAPPTLGRRASAGRRYEGNCEDAGLKDPALHLGPYSPPPFKSLHTRPLETGITGDSPETCAESTRTWRVGRERGARPKQIPRRPE
jgi:hypothetical protein